MTLACLHLATRTARLAALAVCALVLAGCQGVTGIQPVAQIRVIDASPDAPAIDVYQNSQASLYNVGFGTVSTYLPIAPGTYTHTAFTAGTQQQLAQIRGILGAGSQYTLLTGNVAANLQMALLKDQAFPAPSGQVALRFLGQATRSGPVDIYLKPAGLSLSGAAPIATGVNFGTNTGYIAAPSGTYSIVAYPTGTTPRSAAPFFTGIQTTYPATSVRTILLLDQQPAGLQVIAASDFDSAAS
jgi:Domain of unknown function (DUF4397)